MLIYLSPWGLALYLGIKNPQTWFIELGKGSQFKKTRHEGRRRGRAQLSREISLLSQFVPGANSCSQGNGISKERRG